MSSIACFGFLSTFKFRALWLTIIQRIRIYLVPGILVSSTIGYLALGY